ncbi:MAG: hypothetical protein HYY48_10915 [Gammaproteobacteria bacterium]|nr:hypothetical protein [Gammaproteobacteria bacterium]
MSSPAPGVAGMLLLAAISCGCALSGEQSTARTASLEPIRTVRGFSDLATTRTFVQSPRPDRFSVCFGNTCRHVATVKLAVASWDRVRAAFLPAPRDAVEERDRIAVAIAWIESEVGGITGTWRDRGENSAGSGEDGQMDCVDEANNSTVYLEMLLNDGLLRWHRPGPRISRGVSRLLVPHFTATVVQTGTGARFAVDSWFEDNGKPPYIVLLAEWQRGWEPKGDPAAGPGAEVSRRE